MLGDEPQAVDKSLVLALVPLAGKSTRVDFLRKNEKIVIELKKTRPGLDAVKVGEQLLIDIAHYSEHPDCETLACFVYDPDHKISNPRGLENDLSKRSTDRMKVRAVFRPR